MSADLATTSTTDEHVLLRELANYKFLDPPSSNKLTHLRDLHPWLGRIRETFKRFPGVEQIIYSTVAATDEKFKLQAKAYPETPVKLEGESKNPKQEALDKVARQFLSADELATLKTEMKSFGEVTNLLEIMEFLKACSFAKLISANPQLLAYVAPKYAKAGEDSKPSSALEKLTSLEYERVLVPATPLSGYTTLDDTSGYVLPAHNRVAFGDGVVFIYYETGQPESKLHRTLRPYVWDYIVRALANTQFSHYITECKLKYNVSQVVQALIKKAASERYETEQSQAVMTFQMKLWYKDPKQTLQQWYSSAFKEAEVINEITRTYKSEDLEIITKGKINMMFKIHADAMGYRELGQRVARENGGLVPMDILLSEIELSDTIRSRDSATDSFSAKHSNLLNQGKQSGGGLAPPPNCCEHSRSRLLGGKHSKLAQGRKGRGDKRRQRWKRGGERQHFRESQSECLFQLPQRHLQER